MDEQSEIYLTPKKAAELLGVHPLTLYRWAKKGKIKYIVTPGGRCRYPLSEIKRIAKAGSGINKRFFAAIYLRREPRESEESISKRINKLRTYIKKKGLILGEVIIEDASEISQRKLSKKLNISLGMINYLIKELTKKGLVKVENFKKSKNKLSYRYLLTPKGVEEKLKLTYYFLKRKMEEYERLQREIEDLKKELKEEENYENA